MLLYYFDNFCELLEDAFVDKRYKNDMLVIFDGTSHFGEVESCISFVLYFAYECSVWFR